MQVGYKVVEGDRGERTRLYERVQEVYKQGASRVQAVLGYDDWMRGG